VYISISSTNSIELIEAGYRKTKKGGEMIKEKKMKEIKSKVEEVIKSIRPSLRADGGDVELMEVSGEGIIKVRLIGACSGCMMSQITLKAGIERYIKKQIPEVKEVVSVP
jgi:Fe-S cluster biogenesis protein NfuA